MKYSNFFKFQPTKIMLLIFIILSICHIIYATLVYRALMVDGILYFPEILNKCSAQGYGFVPVIWRTRIFVCIINQLPVNFAYWLGIQSKLVLAAIYSLPLFLFPFLVTMYNFILAKRTKRYDIVLISLILYNLLILPAIMYSVVEVYLGSVLLIVLLHYFLADITYSKKDILIIVFLTFLLYSLTELSVFVCILLILFYKFFSFDNQKKKEIIVRIFILLQFIFSSLFILYMNIFILPNINNESISFIKELTDDRNNLFLNLLNEPYIVEIFSAILIIASLIFFYKRKFNKPQIISLIILYVGLLIYMIANTNQYFYRFHFISYRVFIFIIFPLLIFLLFLISFKKFYINKKILFNIIIITLLAGITNTFIQLIYSHKVQSLQTQYMKIVNSTNKKFLDPEKDLYEFYIDSDNIYFSIMSPTAYQIIFSKEYKQKKLVLPLENNSWYTCLEFNDNKNVFYLYNTQLAIKNKFWDLTDIGKEFMEDKTLSNKYKKVHSYVDIICQPNLKVFFTNFILRKKPI